MHLHLLGSISPGWWRVTRRSVSCPHASHCSGGDITCVLSRQRARHSLHAGSLHVTTVSSAMGGVAGQRQPTAANGLGQPSLCILVQATPVRRSLPLGRSRASPRRARGGCSPTGAASCRRRLTRCRRGFVSVYFRDGKKSASLRSGQSSRSWMAYRSDHLLYHDKNSYSGCLYQLSVELVHHLLYKLLVT